MSYFATAAIMTLHGSLVAATKAKSSTASTSILLLVVIVAIGYFLLIRPQRQRARKAQVQNQSATVGDEVMLTSGIFGRVTGIEGDRANIEIAPDIEIEVVMRAIAQRVAPVDVAPAPEQVSPDPAGDEDEDFAHASDDPSDEHGDGDATDGELPDLHDAGTAWPPTAVKPADSDIGNSVPGGGITSSGSAGGGITSSGGSAGDVNGGGSTGGGSDRDPTTGGGVAGDGGSAPSRRSRRGTS